MGVSREHYYKPNIVVFHVLLYVHIGTISYLITFFLTVFSNHSFALLESLEERKNISTKECDPGVRVDLGAACIRSRHATNRATHHTRSPDIVVRPKLKGPYFVEID